MDDTASAPATKPRQPSAKQIAANRANATRSTGPRTAEGKSRSRLNAMRHGLLATEAVNRASEGAAARAAFDELTDRLENHYQPQGPVEEILVQKIAVATWRLKRLLRFEARGICDESTKTEIFEQSWSGDTNEYIDRRRKCRLPGEPGLPDEDDLRLLLRYENAVNRDLYRAIGELRKLRKERASFPDSENNSGGEGSTAPSQTQNYQTNPIEPAATAPGAVERRSESVNDPGGPPAG